MNRAHSAIPRRSCHGDIKISRRVRHGEAKHACIHPIDPYHSLENPQVIVNSPHSRSELGAHDQKNDAYLRTPKHVIKCGCVCLSLSLSPQGRSHNISQPQDHKFYTNHWTVHTSRCVLETCPWLCFRASRCSWLCSTFALQRSPPSDDSNPSQTSSSTARCWTSQQPWATWRILMTSEGKLCSTQASTNSQRPAINGTWVKACFI